MDLFVRRHFWNAKDRVCIFSMRLFSKRLSLQEAFFLDSKFRDKDKNANLMKLEKNENLI